MTTDEPHPAESPDPAHRQPGAVAPPPKIPGSLTLGTRSLRALAHPVRVRLLGLLREHGPSTATRLATQLGLNSGATSYHLRQLAAGGLVEEDRARGNARDRWWRSVHRATYFDPYEVPEEDRDAGAAYMGAIAAQYAERIQDAARNLQTLPEAWQRSGDLSDFRLQLTPEQSAAIIAELHQVVARYRRSDEPLGEPPPGAEQVVIQVQVMPQLGSTGTDPHGLDATTTPEGPPA